MNKKFIAKLLVLAMIMAMVPATIIAASAAGSNSGYYGVAADTSTTVTVSDPITDGTIEPTISGSTASVKLSDAAVESLADLVEDGAIVLEINTQEATRLDVTLPIKTLTAVAEDTGADLTIKSGVATITIPNDILKNDLGTVGNVKISVRNTSTSVSFSIQASGTQLSTKGIKVEF